MVEFRTDGPSRVTVVQEGRAAGEVRWTPAELAWGRERVKTVRLETLDCPAELTADLWDYLRYLWQKEAVAAVRMPDGTLTWFSHALERSWRAAGLTVEYRDLALEEVQLPLFDCFDRRQAVTNCWRRENGAWVIREDPFLDDWSPADRRTLVDCLRDTLTQGGLVRAAFVEDKLKGFAAVLPQLFGGAHRYLDLAALHVSQELRGQGIGAALFQDASNWARTHGAGKLYISAHSAVETQSFYAKMGCVDASLPHPDHVAREPFDRQLELVL